jgi:hypothetical protein
LIPAASGQLQACQHEESKSNGLDKFFHKRILVENSEKRTSKSTQKTIRKQFKNRTNEPEDATIASTVNWVVVAGCSRRAGSFCSGWIKI